LGHCIRPTPRVRIKELQVIGTFMSQSNIKIMHYEGEPCIEIKGEWDQAGLDSLIKAFQKHVPKVESRMFLRMAELDYLDSAGLGVIMFNMNELAKKNAKLILLEPSDEMRQILRTTSLDKVLEIR
jgi:anti-anti-sigma factor